MATQTSGSGDFINNLGKIYGFYAGGFLAFVVLLGILEQVGVPNRVLGYLFVFFTIAVYAIIGVLSRSVLQRRLAADEEPAEDEEPHDIAPIT